MKSLKNILLLTFVLFGFYSQAQLNIKAGYNLGFVQAQVHKQIYERYNTDNSWLTQELEPFNILNGLQLGVRYKFENLVALEFNWQNQYHRKAASGTDPSDNSNFTRSVSFRYSSLGLGIENFIGPVSFGASFNYDFINYKTSTTDIDQFRVLKDTGWSSHFFVSFNFEGGRPLSLSLRPYAQIPWTTFNLQALNDALNPSDTSINLEESYTTFGIMLIFYNGKN